MVIQVRWWLYLNKYLASSCENYNYTQETELFFKESSACLRPPVFVSPGYPPKPGKVGGYGQVDLSSSLPGYPQQTGRLQITLVDYRTP